MGSPFRKEALEARQAPLSDPQRWLGDDPRWLSAAQSVVIWGLVAVGALLVLGRVNEYASGPALVLAAERTNLPARAPGIVEAVMVKPGQSVSAGMPLILLDAAVERAALEANADEFRKQLQRALLDPAEEAPRTALAELASRRAAANAAVKARTVSAPWDGVVSDIRVQEGQHIGAGELLLSICKQNGRFEVLAFLPGAAGPELHVGMQLQLRLAGRARVRQTFVITDVGAQVVGPAEARRYLGPAFADSLELSGPSVMVRAATNTSGFVDGGRALAFFDGLQGAAEVATGQSTLLVLLMPWLKDLTWLN